MKRKLIFKYVLAPGLVLLAATGFFLGLNEAFDVDGRNEAQDSSNATSLQGREDVKAEFDAAWAAYQDDSSDREAYLGEITQVANQQLFAAVVTDGASQVVIGAGSDTEETVDFSTPEEGVEGVVAVLQDQFEVTEPDFTAKYQWVFTTLMVLIPSLLMLLGVVIMLDRRDAKLPITWAEAIIYTSVLTWFLLLGFGVVPHYLLKVWDTIIAEGKISWLQFVFDSKTVADGDLRETGTFYVWGTEWIADNLFFWTDQDHVGIQVAWVAVRDILITGWYGLVTVGGGVLAFFGQKQLAAAEDELSSPSAIASPYGRPVLTPGKS